MESIANELVANVIRNFFVCLGTYCTIIKFTNKKQKAIIKTIFIILITSVLSALASKESGLISSLIVQILLISILYSFVIKVDIGYALIITAICLSINNIIYLIAIIFNYIINNFYNIQNNYINLLILILFYIFILYSVLKLKRIKNGISFLSGKLKNEYFNILILNISVIILFSFTIFTSSDINFISRIFFMVIIFSAIMFVTIQKSLQLYYKQKMLVKDLEETKEELENKKKEVEALEKENLEFSKISHSIAHKQKSLEHKLNELSMKSEIADELDIKDRIDDLSKNLMKETIVVLDKTGITEIDDMLSYMQSECVKNKIDFQLQLNGNIYTMINHHIDKEELEILLADHIKNAIIAIGYGDNVNKSILVRLGKIDGSYGLYVYDSGIEFEIETLLNLGKKPSTTHKDSGGTGMGFMNTFDTLRKHNASFIIEEYGKPVKDNFTKALKFKFNGKNEFKICSYREEEIKNKDRENCLIVEKLSL